MSGTVINISVGGSGAGGETSAGIPGGRDPGRMIFNDLTSRSLADMPYLDWQLVSGGLLIQNQSHIHATQKAKTVQTFRPSASNANSGVRFRNDFGMAQGLGSYCRGIFKLIDLGADNPTHNVAIGWNSTSDSNSIGNSGLFLKITADTVFVENKAGVLVQTSATQVFSSYGILLDVEIDYTADDAVTVTVKNLADGTILHTFAITGTDLPNYTNQVSGAHGIFQAHFLKTTLGSVDHVAVDYVGFYGG